MSESFWLPISEVKFYAQLEIIIGKSWPIKKKCKNVQCGWEKEIEYILLQKIYSLYTLSDFGGPANKCYSETLRVKKLYWLINVQRAWDIWQDKTELRLDLSNHTVVSQL